MGVAEKTALCIVLLLALYGFARGMMTLAERLLRPSRPNVSVLLILNDREDLEQQIRYGKWLSKEWRVPLCTQGTVSTEESEKIVRVLLGNSCAEVLRRS